MKNKGQTDEFSLEQEERNEAGGMTAISSSALGSVLALDQLKGGGNAITLSAQKAVKGMLNHIAESVTRGALGKEISKSLTPNTEALQAMARNLRESGALNPFPKGVPAKMEWLEAGTVLGFNEWAASTVKREAKKPLEPLVQCEQRNGITLTLQIEPERKLELPQLLDEIAILWLQLFGIIKRQANVRRGAPQKSKARHKKEEQDFWKKFCPAVWQFDDNGIKPKLPDVAGKMHLSDSQLQRRCRQYANAGHGKPHFNNAVKEARKKRCA